MASQEETLLNLGLSKNEAKIYLELLGLGETTAVVIAKKTKLHRTNVYDALERLIEKGLVAYIHKENTKFYEAAKPDNLLNLLKEKEIELKAVLPSFTLNYNLSKKKTDIHVAEGMAAVKNMLEKLLEYGQPIYVYGIPKQAIEMMGAFIIDYHQRRIKKKIPMIHIYNEDAQQRIEYLNSIPYTEARYLPKEYNSVISTNICGNSVALILFTKNPMVIHIENPEIASAYKKYFDILWGMAKK